MASDALSLLVSLPLVKVGGSSHVANAVENQIQKAAPIDARLAFVELPNQGTSCVMGTDGTASAEFMLFGDIGQQVVGNQVSSVLRANRGGDDIPPDIAQVVSKKFTWHVSITEKSFQGPRKSYQVNRIVVSLGRQSAIPRMPALLDPIASSSHATPSNLQTSYSIELQYTPPHPQLIHDTGIDIHESTNDVGATPTFTCKRLFDAASGSTEHNAPSKRTSSGDRDSPPSALQNRSSYRPAVLLVA